METAEKTTPIGPGGVGIEGKRVKYSFCPLQAILSAASLVGACCGVRSSGEFGQGHGADGNQLGERRRFNLLEVDDY